MLFNRQFYKKETPSPALNSCEFLRFFKNISGRMLLEKHWVSLKTVPIAFPVNVSNTDKQKGLKLFVFFFSFFFFPILFIYLFIYFWDLLKASSWIFLWNLLSKFFLYFSFLCFIMGIYIFMALWTLTIEPPALTNIQKQLSSKLSFSQ